jgi:hypothetical protein
MTNLAKRLPKWAALALAAAALSGCVYSGAGYGYGPRYGYGYGYAPDYYAPVYVDPAPVVVFGFGGGHHWR